MLKQVQRQSTVIIKEPGYYHGWPSIAHAADGELVVVFSGRRAQHVCPYGVTILVRSQDDGTTWSAPEVVNDTPLDDRDAGIVILRDGTWLVTWFTSTYFADNADNCRTWYGDAEVDAWRDDIARVTPDVKAKWLGNWSRRSTDRGQTWEPMVATGATSPHGPIELADGRLLYVGGWETWKREHKEVVDVLESADEGRSWSLCGQIPIAPGTRRDWYTEPHAVETAEGRVVCLFRFEIEPPSTGTGSPFRHDFMQQTESGDGGRSWTPMRETLMQCHPPHAIRLQSGNLLAVYGGRYRPYGERGCLSKDGGKTWNIANEFVIRDDAPNGDLGYPASVQLPDGSIYTVYYQVDQPGEKPCIIGTHWWLPL